MNFVIDNQQLNPLQLSLMINYLLLLTAPFKSIVAIYKNIKGANFRIFCKVLGTIELWRHLKNIALFL